MHEVLVNRLGGLSLPRKSVVRLTDRPDMTLDVYRGRKTTMQKKKKKKKLRNIMLWPLIINLSRLSVLIQLTSHLTLLHSERPKFAKILAFLSATGLN